MRLRPVVVLLFAAFAANANAASEVERGHAILEKNCGRCHATGEEGASAHPPAPAFRDLGERYPVGDIAEALAEGIITGHPEMPEFAFDPDEIDAIIAYLQSIQPK